MRTVLITGAGDLGGRGRIGIVLVGTLVRAWFGWSHQLWGLAPDQAAWDLALADVAHHGLPGFKHLIHYPHEGGSLPLSLIALLCMAIPGPVPPLSWAALLVDALVRYLQIGWAARLFGPRTGLVFGAWTVLAVPTMLPWATVNFGLHALMAFAPFAVAVMLKEGAGPFRTGLVIGGLASLAYDVWVLLPVCLAWWLMVDRGRSPRAWAALLAGAALAFLPHALVRLSVDLGFGSEQWAPLSVRGAERSELDPRDWPVRFVSIWADVIPGSFTMGPVTDPGVRAIAWCVLPVLLIGSAVSLMRSGRAAAVAGAFVLAFTGAMAVLPLFTIRADGTGIVHYRYVPFIMPLLALLVVDGVCRMGRWWKGAALAWLAGCAALSIVYMVRTPVAAHASDEATGWVLGRKYGERPGDLLRMMSLLDPDRRPDFLRGCGWGTAAALFDGRGPRDREAIERGRALLTAYPSEAQAEVWRGVERAFDPAVTPRLDPIVLDELRREGR
ncbi:MAG: hypothetical protein JNJ64_15665 [Flavobacteriales bacterium]|nr:hypothetical protein [Flavobacteriales bacterium]